MPSCPTFGRPAALAALGLALAASTSGCAGGPFSRWRMAMDDSLSKPPSRAEARDDRNLFARLFSPEKPAEARSIADFLRDRGPGASIAPAKPDPEGEAEFAAAQALEDEGQLDAAAKAYGRLARKKKDTPLGEKSQFRLAEVQFAQKKYFRAHDSYELLFTHYPGTRYLDTVVKREHAIGKAWLADVDPEAQPGDALPWHARFTGGMPFVDSHGHALRAFEHVRHHDPTGPLADRAAMDIADQHYRDGDFETAALVYDQVVADHPKSPLVKKAMLTSVDSKIKGYLGPYYDVTGLEEAEKSVKKAKTFFPELRASAGDEPDELDHTLDLIDDQMAERTYETGDYYRKAGHAGAAEYYFTWVTRRWPKSEWAEKAKVQMVKVEAMPRKQALMSKIMTLPGSTDPFTGNSMTGASGGMSPMSGPNGMSGP